MEMYSLALVLFKSAPYANIYISSETGRGIVWPPTVGVVGGRANSIDYDLDSKEVVLQRMILRTASAYAILPAKLVDCA